MKITALHAIEAALNWEFVIPEYRQRNATNALTYMALSLEASGYMPLLGPVWERGLFSKALLALVAATAVSEDRFTWSSS